jgi:hypothetical protein
MIANLLVFYKGGLSYTEAQNLPIPELCKLNALADRIRIEQKKASERNGI